MATESVDEQNGLASRFFENALGAFFRGEDPVLHSLPIGALTVMPGSNTRKVGPGTALYTKGIQLLERFAQDDRICIHDPQIKIVRNLTEENEFLGYVDAIGGLDGRVALSIGKLRAHAIQMVPKVCYH